MCYAGLKSSKNCVGSLDFSNENKANTVSQAGESTFNNFDQTDIMGIVSMTDFDMKSHTNKKQSSGRRWENV